MSPLRQARKEHRKLPFLKAFARIGSISGSAKACRISRETVHRWIRRDSAFARALAVAKMDHDRGAFSEMEAALVLFTNVVLPVVPAGYRPRIAAELAIVTANLRKNLSGDGRTPTFASGLEGHRMSALRLNGVAAFHRDMGYPSLNFKP